MKKLFFQFFGFIGISGIGWLIDFSIYTCLTSFTDIPVAYANMISSFPAITLVFIVSTRKIFDNGGKIPVYAKYIIYLFYQFVLVALVSMAAGKLAPWLGEIFEGKFENISKLLAKIAITPITMVMNFIVMKLMTEKM
ncbi:MAG: GtrA family protein [Eubacteriales bacterium]|nr:GtrA family protein [Eubacteriales bacterium]